MEVKLVHPDDPEGVVVATHPIQVAALKGQGFVEAEYLAETQARAAEEKNELEQLREKLAEAEAKAKSESEARVKAEAETEKAKSDAEAALKAAEEAEAKLKELSQKVKESK